MSPLYALGAAAILTALPHNVPASDGFEFTDADEIISVESVPIENLHRITRADGNVFYIANDGRWVITGEVIDMWTGKHEHTLGGAYDRLKWSRTGTSIEKVPPKGWGTDREPPEAVVFFTHWCHGCDELGQWIEEGGVSPAPYGPPDSWDEWGSIWCHQALELDILMSWLQNGPEIETQNYKLADHEGQCEMTSRVGTALAFVDIYNIYPNEPTLIDREGRIVRGAKEINRWLKQ